MSPQVLRGSKQEIAEMIIGMTDEVREVIVIVEDPTAPLPGFGEDMFAEMKPYEAKVSGADCSREAIYTRMEGE